MTMAGLRLDMVAAEMFPDYSRARLQAWIKSGELTLNQRTVKPNTKVVGGESLHLNAEPEAQGEWQAEAMALAVVYEDESLLVVNKPADLVVHPAAGNYEGTLLNGLLHHCPALQQIPRAGIVHRLDKDTTGLMVVAKTLKAQAALVAQLQARTVSREYVALVIGMPPGLGEVEAAIGRDPNNRKKMAVVAAGKEAVTHYRVIAQLGPLAWLALRLKTGRTHQIRVHMNHLGYPLVGDPVYGRRHLPEKELSAEQIHVLTEFKRQALHARALELIHPDTGASCRWQAPLPEDLSLLLKAFSYEP